MKTLQVAIIGQGRSGRDIHGAYFHMDTERFHVAAIVDELDFRRERAKEEFGCDVYADYTALLQRRDIDFVINASYSHQHVAISRALLEAGFNVLSEKPAARHADELRALEALAQERGVVFAVFQQSRFAPYFQKVQSILQSGVLGRIIQVNIAFNGFARRWDWQTLQEFNGGNLLNTGPHPLDQALQILNYEGMPQVFCRMDRVNTFGDAEDYVKLILTAPNRPLIDLEISSCDAYPQYTYKIHGEHGGLKGSMTDIEWRWHVPGEAPAQRLLRESLRDSEGRPMYCGERLVWEEERWHIDDARTFTSAVRRYYDELYARITEDTPMTVTLPQVIQQIAVMEECHKQNPLSRLDA